MEISVVIVNYNYEKFLARAIRSALNQSFNRDEYEVIVVDDCSTDNSRDVIDSFGNSIKSIFNEHNKGLSESCNLAVRKATGKFTYFLDADDFINKDTLLVCHSFVSHNKESMDAVGSRRI